MNYFTNSRSKSVTVVLLGLVAGIFVFSATQSQQASGKTRRLSKNRPEHAARQAPVPDLVAYELFLRTVAEADGSGLIKRAALSDREVEAVLSEATAFDEILQATDKRASEIKEDRNAPLDSQKQAELSSLQSAREDVLSRTVNSILPNSLDATAISKLQDFINSEVKPYIQAVSIKNTSKRNNHVYLYNASWQNTLNVYGAGVISADYASQAVYRATVIITSPSGRSNTVRSDSLSETVRLQSASLPIGVEDGEYNVRVIFENQTADRKGGAVIGETISSVTVAPVVNVESVNPSEIDVGSADTRTFTATVSLTNDVPVGTQIVVEMYETSTPAFSYSVAPVNRVQSLTVGAGDPGTTKTVAFDVTITTNNGTGAGTTVTNKFRIQSVSVPPGATTVTAGTNQPTGTLKYIYAPTPTPTPPPPPPTPTPIPGTCNQPPPCATGFVMGGNGLCTRSQQFQSRCAEPSGYDPETCTCPDGTTTSPIIIDVDHSGFSLTDAAGGVNFDILSAGFAQHVSWTAINSTNAFLALDRNGNGTIDSGEELFGDITEQPASGNPNGFIALSEYDKFARGGNGDGRITAQDAIFSSLRLWQDTNHNGISEASELHSLAELGLAQLDLKYKASRRTDEFGNEFRYRARVFDNHGEQIGRWAWDVFLKTLP